MNETTGVLKPVVTRYLEGNTLDADQVRIMRAYLRQWVNAPGFIGEDVARLRRDLDRIESTGDLHEWLTHAEDAGVDPL